jgi:RND family efflux transporter MFP subunit
MYRSSILIALTLLAVAGCDRATPPVEPQPRPVRTEIVAPGAGGAITTYTAEIRARHEADLSFQVGGKVVTRKVDAGTVVRRGDVLAVLDETDQRVQVDAARAAVRAARAELERARTEETRFRDLLERGLTTRAAYLAQQTAVKTGQSLLEQAAAEQLLAEQRLGYTTLRANDDGVITRTHAEVGSVVSAGQPVVTLAQLSELDAVFDAPDARVGELRAAGAVAITAIADPKIRVTATIREIAPSADPVTRTYQVKAAIDESAPSLRLGAIVAAAIEAPSAGRAVALPATALFQKGSGPAVWLVGADLKIELRPVTVDRYESDRVVITAGLHAGERVVTAGVHRLAEGELVRLLAETHR